MSGGDQAGLPASPFFATPQTRVALARQRFFEEGVRPSGIVAEAVIQSWARCLRLHPDPSREAVFQPVTVSRMHSALRGSRQLLEAAKEELALLQATLAGTCSTAMLTDALGVVVSTTYAPGSPHERVMPLASRVGVNLAEELVGTTAPGIVARTGQPSIVLGGEHFFGNVTSMYCAAAPIRDIRGRVAGVLDLSNEHLPFSFDAASIVALYAAAIEGRLLCAQSTDHLVIRLQITPPLLDTPMVGLVGIGRDGRLDWVNAAAARLMGVPVTLPQGAGPLADDVFGLSVDALASLSLSGEAAPLRLPNGLAVWVRSRVQARDGRRGLHQVACDAMPQDMPARAAVAAPPPGPPTLRDNDRDLVARTVEGCGGNISEAARLLGVSRGLVYRRLRRE
ncbi:helix-turn-helix domain-containing protein [Piscinibacter sp. XHJ-5]|uniref:helix-turn-helix domain-containing protein n=1 Tax=Piscinibacter sp. XHJ-5 TaxID=3037797 RepID=UPI002452F9ED|nr:helix-turn-helix domain-containing protein [Piscinibacter sp. XHJ-5]